MHALECLANAQLGRKDSELLSESQLADHEFLQDIGHGIGCESIAHVTLTRCACGTSIFE